VPATKSASWTECGSLFDATNYAVILPNEQLDYSGNEPVLSSPLEIDELCNQVFAVLIIEDTMLAVFAYRSLSVPAGTFSYLSVLAYLVEYWVTLSFVKTKVSNLRLKPKLNQKCKA